MKNHEKQLYAALEKHFDDFVGFSERQIAPETNVLLNTASEGLDEPNWVAWSYPWLLIGYYSPAFSRYHDSTLLERALALMEELENRLHEDGSLDLLITNFHDPSQVGFTNIYQLFATELLYRFTEHTPLEDRLYETMVRIFRKMGTAMATLGFHTPNHRWVISAGLSVAYRYTKEPLFLEAVNGFLKEGIDCDEYGEYTERSTGCYNNICNRSFSMMAHLLDPKFLEYPRRNLKLMRSFTEPDLSVNTLNSSRWDQAGAYNLAPYYPFYLICALVYDDREFAYYADTLLEKYGADSFIDSILYCFFLLYPELTEKIETMTPKAPDPDASVFLPNSHIARIYKPQNDLTMTVLKTRHPVFFQLNYGSDVLQVRFAGAFFGDPHSQFRAKEILPIADGYRLIAEETAGYRSQFSEAPETSNWRHMDHSKRSIINKQTFRTVIDVHIKEDGASFDVDAGGCENILTKLEFILAPGGKLDTESIAVRPQAGDYLYLKKGNARYFLDGNRYFEIDGGFISHTYGENMRGSAPVSKEKVTLAMTAKTPCQSHVEVTVKKIY